MMSLDPPGRLFGVEAPGYNAVNDSASSHSHAQRLAGALNPSPYQQAPYATKEKPPLPGIAGHIFLLHGELLSASVFRLFARRDH